VAGAAWQGPYGRQRRTTAVQALSYYFFLFFFLSFLLFLSFLPFLAMRITPFPEPGKSTKC